MIKLEILDFGLNTKLRETKKDLYVNIMTLLNPTAFDESLTCKAINNTRNTLHVSLKEVV